MVTILCSRHSGEFPFDRNSPILIQISLVFVTEDLIDAKPSLVQVMAWRRTYLCTYITLPQ